MVREAWPSISDTTFALTSSLRSSVAQCAVDRGSAGLPGRSGERVRAPPYHLSCSTYSAILSCPTPLSECRDTVARLQQLSQNGPDRLWVADMTYLRSREGF